MENSKKMVMLIEFEDHVEEQFNDIDYAHFHAKVVEMFVDYDVEIKSVAVIPAEQVVREPRTWKGSLD